MKTKRVGKRKVSLAQFALPEFEEAVSEALAPLVKNAIAEYLDTALSEGDGVTVHFPFEWARKGRVPARAELMALDPAKPLTVRVELPFGEYIEDRLAYDFDLADALKKTMEYCAEDGSYSEGLSAIAKELRRLADAIEAAIAEGRASPAA